MDNWSRAWRKLVEWNQVNKVYVYKGREILPLSYKEQIEMPTHLQNSYYWSEIQIIDRVVAEENKPHKPVEYSETAQAALDLFFESFEW